MRKRSQSTIFTMILLKNNVIFSCLVVTIAQEFTALDLVKYWTAWVENDILLWASLTVDEPIRIVQFTKSALHRKIAHKCDPWRVGARFSPPGRTLEGSHFTFLDSRSVAHSKTSSPFLPLSLPPFPSSYCYSSSDI